MNALRAALEAIAAYGFPVLLGVTAVLACGIVVMLCHRSPVQRRRLGVLTALGVLLYLLVGLAPLPRLAVLDSSGDAPVARAVTSTSLRTPDADARAAALLLAIQGITSAHVENADAAAAAPVVPVPAAPAVAAPAAAPLSPLLARAAAVPWSLVVAGLYALGVAVWLVRTIGASVRLGSLLAQCRPVPVAALRAVAVPAGTRVVSTTRSLRPFCAGVRAPVIVLPEPLLAADRAAEATAVLRHEVAHVRADDPRVWSLLAWLAVPLWCHPLFWWLCREVRFCSELLADDAAARAGDRERYARALIDLAERSTHHVAAAGTVAIFHRPSEFYRRIQMLLSRQGSLSTNTSRVRRFAQSFSMLCLVGAAASAFGVPAAAQDPVRTLRRENEDLRATLDTLRTELATLRDQIAVLRANAATTEQAGIVELLARDGVKQRAVMDFLKQRGMRGGDFGSAAATPSPSVDVPVPSPEAAPEDPTAVAGMPAAQDPLAAPPADVPVLGGLPLLGNLFRANGVVAGTPAEPSPLPDLADVRMGRLDANGHFTPALREYTVQKGDSLERIAARELGSTERIAEVLEHNPGIEPQQLRVGQRLQLPVVGLAPDATNPIEPGVVVPATPSMGDGVEAHLRDLLAARGFGAAPDTVPAPDTSSAGVAALAELTSRYLDLQAELEVQRIEAAETKSMAEAGHATPREARRAEATLRATEKKLAIASRLIDGEVAATEAELQWIASRRADSSPSEARQLEMQARRAHTRLEALQAVK